MNGDTPIHRKTFLEMTDEEQVAFISALRERRLAPINTYNEVKEANRQKRIGKLNEKIEKAEDQEEILQLRMQRLYRGMELNSTPMTRNYRGYYPY